MTPPLGPVAAPTAAALLTDWRPDYLVIAVVVALGVGYGRTRLLAARRGLDWPLHRDVLFGMGLVALVWTSNGFPEARGFQLMWVWMVQQLLLLLIVPVILLSAQPLSLARMVHGDRALPLRLRDAGPLRLLGNPLVGPVLVPVLCLLLVFGGLGAFSLQSVLAGGAVHLLLLLAGALVALPLVSTDDERTSLAVGLSLGVGFVELILDAFPGIVLRFQTHVVLVHFALARPAFAPVGIDDQHIAGGILWVVAEVLDLPFLILAATRWIKADAREAAGIDAQLDARQHWAEDGTAVAAPVVERPWWLDDPELRGRFGGGGPGRDQE